MWFWATDHLEIRSIQISTEKINQWKYFSLHPSLLRPGLERDLKMDILSFRTNFIGRGGLTVRYTWASAGLYLDPFDIDEWRKLCAPEDPKNSPVMKFLEHHFYDACGCSLPMDETSYWLILVLVNETIFSDSRPFWDGVLKHEETYVVVYRMALEPCFFFACILIDDQTNLIWPAAWFAKKIKNKTLSGKGCIQRHQPILVIPVSDRSQIQSTGQLLRRLV